MKLRYYIEDLIYGANDGVITTFAIVAGVIGAGLPPATILIIGLANVFADGFSMASSDYLARTSRRDMMAFDGKSKSQVSDTNPFMSAILTFIAFVTLGFVPLATYYYLEGTEQVFLYTVLITGCTLFIIGALRALVTKRSFLEQGFQMLIVGGLAATIAYFVGEWVSSLL